jgi:hypothetical protein
MKFKKIIFAILIVSFLIGHPTPTHAAAAWGTLNIIGDMMKQMMEEISEQIKIAINSAAKMAAIKQATSTIESLLYGDSTSPRNIKNFQDFLVAEPSEKAVTYGQDFLTSALRGTTSGDYTSASGGSGFLSKPIENAGQNIIKKWSGDGKATVDYQEHCGSDYFANGDYKCFSAIMSNPLNTPLGMALATDGMVAAKYQAEQLEAQVTATSSGVLPAMDEIGNIKLPSSIVETIQSQQITLPLDALANGDSGVFSSAIQSFAIGIITDIVERGLGTVQEAAEKNVAAIESQYDTQMKEMSAKVGPVMEYSNDAYAIGQKLQSVTSTWDNPDTPEDESKQDSTTSTPSSEEKFVNPTTGEVTTGVGASAAEVEWSLSTEGYESRDTPEAGREWVQQFNRDHNINQ